MNVADVTAVLVTRGDQLEMMSRIAASLIFDNVVVWNNQIRVHDRKTAGRYYALFDQEVTDVVYFQDDDVIVPADTQRALVDAYMPETMVANWAHGDNPDGYDDLPLVGCGAIVDRELPWDALDRYLTWHDLDDTFLYEADFIAGCLYPAFKHVYLPFEINLDIAQHESRLCNQPWQRDRKLEATERARTIRDHQQVAA